VSWFIPKPVPFEAKQWPRMGLTVLMELVGDDKVIVAQDGTVYVIVSSGHPQRLDPGWWVSRSEAGAVSVFAEGVRRGWEEISRP